MRRSGDVSPQSQPGERRTLSQRAARPVPRLRRCTGQAYPRRRADDRVERDRPAPARIAEHAHADDADALARLDGELVVALGGGTPRDALSLTRASKVD